MKKREYWQPPSPDRTAAGAAAGGASPQNSSLAIKMRSVIGDRAQLLALLPRVSLTGATLFARSFVLLALDSTKCDLFQFDIVVDDSTPPRALAVIERTGFCTISLCLLPTSAPPFSKDALRSPPLDASDSALVAQCLKALTADLVIGSFQYGHVLDNIYPLIAQHHDGLPQLNCSENFLRQFQHPVELVSSDASANDAAPLVEWRPLTAEHAPLVWQHWPYRAKRPVEAIERLLGHRRSMAAFVGLEPVCWAIEQAYGGMGMLHTLEAHRRRGLATQVVRRLAQLLLEPVQVAVAEDGGSARSNEAPEPAVSVMAASAPYCYVACENQASNAMFDRAGFVATDIVSWVYLDMIGKK